MVSKKFFFNIFIILALLFGLFSEFNLAHADGPISIWSPEVTPTVLSQPEDLPVELGVAFKSDVGGYITGIRFYKGSGNNGPHYGHLWTTAGDLLGTATFANETATGWQQALFPTPIAITQNTEYLASYHTPSGHWSFTASGLSTRVYNPPLTALASGDSTLGNGVYEYGPNGSFPNETYGSANYWVDVVFDTSIPVDNTSPTVSSVSPISNAEDVDLNSIITALFSEAMSPATLTNNITISGPSGIVAATLTYNPGTYTASLSPELSLTGSTVYTVTIKGDTSGVTDLAGNSLATDYTWSFTTTAPDVTPPTVSAVTPANDASGVVKSTTVTARFSEAMAAGTINTSNFELRDPDNYVIESEVTYAPGSFLATLDPASDLASSTTYTAKILSGTSGVTDLAGNSLATDYTWSFTTAISPDQGPGGPILVIAGSENSFGRYYAEILRNEGLNEFYVMDLSLVTSGILANYDVVILGETPLSVDNVSMFTAWVNAGGNLIAMRPDKKLAGLLGITEASGVLPPTGQLNAYLKVDNSSEPGRGIVNETIQYHGLADLYTLDTGTTAVATLYSDASTVTVNTNPAVTLRNIGTIGGQAAAFTYDLARSVVYTRQGNPAWAGQNRDPNDTSVSRIISHDMFFGNATYDPQPDYVDFNKLTIPQADEQQRLLANLIQFMNQDKKPLPHFWYFPRGEKAVVIMTGDDHGSGPGTIGRFDHYKAISAPGCSVNNWECIRGSSFMFDAHVMTDAQAAAYTADGFEIGVHVHSNCVDWTPSSLVDFYNNQIASFYSFYSSLPGQLSERTHCVNWTDWVTQPKVQATHGIRMDTNYYYYPSYWVNERPGMFTGSGMPMRFADLDGTMIDVYQAVTQMTDESSLQGYGVFNPLQINTLLENATGAPGYYGAFVANMHTDGNPHPGSETILEAAALRGVPVVSGRQMVNWLDGRNSSSFGDIQWIGDQLSFNISLGEGSNGIQAMIPTSSKTGFFTGLTRDGSTILYTKETIKGIEYAFFDAAAGSYVITYAPDTTSPVISNVTALPAPDGTARITWTTDELSDSLVEYGISPDHLSAQVSNTAMVTLHEINLTGLVNGTKYYFRVVSTDSSENPVTYPQSTNSPLTFTVPDARIIDTTVADFSGGSLVPNTYITNTEDGEVMLTPAAASEFGGTALPAGWSVSQYPANGSNGTAVVSGGLLTLNGAMAGTTATYEPGRSLDFVATFTGGSGSNVYQHIGFAVDFQATAWAIFSTDPSGTLLEARSSDGVAPTPNVIDTIIPGNWIGIPHHFRIEWNASSVVYYIDGNQVANHLITINAPMRPLAGEHAYDPTNTQIVSVDWMRMSPYQAPGTFTSRIWDSVGTGDWGIPEWIADISAGTDLQLMVRTGDTAVPDESWSLYTPMVNGVPIGRSSRYLQYKAEFTTSDTAKTAVLRQVSIGYIHHPDVVAPTIVSKSPLPGATEVALDSNITVTFSETMASNTINTDTIHLRVEGSADDVPAVVTYSGRTAILNPSSSLQIGKVYSIIVSGSVKDVSNNPLGSDVTWTFTTFSQGSFTDNTFSDFSAGTPGMGTYVSDTAGGEVILAPTLGTEFSGTDLPDGWFATEYSPSNSGGTHTVSNGKVTLNGIRLYKDGFYGPGHWLEFEATFNNGSYQHLGFGDTFANAPWGIFTTDGSGQLFSASSNPGGSTTLTPTDYLGVSHRYRIEWNTGSIVYYVYIDGVPTQIASHTGTSTANMRPMAAAYGDSLGKSLVMNWLRMGPYAVTGTFESRIFDAGQTVKWNDLSFYATTPLGTALTFMSRTGETATPDSTWSDWAAVNSPITSPNGRYLQYQASFTTNDTNDPNQTPILHDVTITYGSATPTAVEIANFAAQRVGDTIQLTWDTATEVDLIGFNIYRSAGSSLTRELLTSTAISAISPGSTDGNSYSFIDTTPEKGVLYTYWLEGSDTSGTETFGPLQIGIFDLFLPIMIK